MSCVAVGVGVAAAAGIAAAAMSASASKKAAAQNAKNTQDTNAQNYQMFQEARGSDGNAILPIYMTDLEKQMSADTTSNYNSMAPTGVGALHDSLQPIYGMKDQAVDSVAGIFDGRNEQQRLNSFAPVADARVSFKRQAALDSLSKTLGEINAAQSAKGYTGDTMGERMLGLAANRQAANDVGMAGLQNIEERRGIIDGANNLRLQNAQIPFQLAQQEAAMYGVEDSAKLQQIMNQQRVPAMFNIGPAKPFQNAPLPKVEPIPSTGQVVLSGISQVGGSYFGGAAGKFKGFGGGADGGPKGYSLGGGDVNNM